MNIATSKILKGIVGGTPMIECNFGRIEKTHAPRCPKIAFTDDFLHKVVSNGIDGVNINSLI